MRKALIVGINMYKHVTPLHGCVNDAVAVHELLSRNEDGSKNFDCVLLAEQEKCITRKILKSKITELFSGDCDIALLYFSGHGGVLSTGGYLVPSNSETVDDGISIHDVMTLSYQSRAKNRILIFDCCFAGIAGQSQYSSNSELKEGTTILAAATKDQYAVEMNGSGLFTKLLVDSLRGSAANLLGEVTPGSVYAHIDQSLGSWSQRPVFKTNVQKFVSLRKVKAPISSQELREIVKYFPFPGHLYKLSPEFEPERNFDIESPIPSPDPEKTKIFSLLQKYNRLNLLVPVDAPHMWHAAVYSKSCKLTALGEHYRAIVEKGHL